MDNEVASSFFTASSFFESQSNPPTNATNVIAPMIAAAVVLTGPKGNSCVNHMNETTVSSAATTKQPRTNQNSCGVLTATASPVPTATGMPMTPMTPRTNPKSNMNGLLTCRDTLSMR